MTNFERLSNVQNNPPIWKGLEDSSKNGGITQSLLSKFISCPARMKALVIDNLRPRDKFNHRIQYGLMFHLCDEYHSKGEDWENALRGYRTALLSKYPYDQDDILKWSRVCQIQFSVYLDYWSKYHESSTSLLQEQIFHVPYKLPSGRVVYLRGKWDGVSLDDGGLWIDESKTKGDVDKQRIDRRLLLDLQTMFYLVALRESTSSLQDSTIKNTLSYREGECRHFYPIRGVKYNVVRRPLSGGKGTIKQTKNETIDDYYNRLAQYIKDEPDTYFFRWQSEVNGEDISRFEKNTLIPCLERLCWWYGIHTESSSPVGFNNEGNLSDSINFTMPFGINHVTDEYGTEYDEYILTGSEIGLVKCTELFPELNGE